MSELTITDTKSAGRRPIPDNTADSSKKAVDGFAEADMGRSGLHVVGVGASAGGLEALQVFFKSLPPDLDACFVVIQHLSPDFKSVLAELLQKCTTMPVKQISAKGSVLAPNTVFVSPPRQDVVIERGRLTLCERKVSPSPCEVIDVFFRSLAEAFEERAIAIILSGAGSDGSSGAKVIQSLGGFVLVQAPTDAKFEGMPRSAISAQACDLLLPVEQMASCLARLLERGQEPVALGVPLGGQCKEIDQLFCMLYERTQIDFSQYKESTVARRLERRLFVTESSDLAAYLTYLKQRPAEVATLGKELLIGVTQFFRDASVFELLKQKVLPPIVKSIGTVGEIRIWVPCCSTGEEVYSYAIVLDELCRQYAKSTASIKIYATDIDEDALGEAAKGCFPLEITQSLSEARLHRYFMFCDNHYQIDPGIRKMVLFARHDLARDPPFSSLHLVSCRNALIYFKPALQHRVLSSLNFSLNLGGILVLGLTETLGDLASFFDAVDGRQRVFCKHTQAAIPSIVPSGQQAKPALGMPLSDSLTARSSAIARGSIMSSVAELLLTRFGPASVLLDDTFRALHVFGDVSRFFRVISAGRVSTKITDLLVDDLLVPVTTALQQAEEKKEDVFYSDVCVRHGEDTLNIKVGVICIAELDFQKVPDYFVVIFDAHDREILSEQVVFDHHEQSQKRIKYLEDQLARQRENLQITREEFETTNEELQTTNEELSSANEELHSTNQELQSVNEEVYTVNGEYQEKIRELLELNNDMENVLRSSNLALLFLDRDLKIRRFSQAMTSYIALAPADIGRPVTEVPQHFHDASFYEKISAVLKTNKPAIVMLNNPDGSALELSIMPYLDQDNAVHGVVITVTHGAENGFDVVQAYVRVHAHSRQVFLQERLACAALEGLLPFSVLIVNSSDEARAAIERFSGEVFAEKASQIHSAATIPEAVAVLRASTIDICLVSETLGKGESPRLFMDQMAGIGLKRLPAVIMLCAEEQPSRMLVHCLHRIHDFLPTTCLSVRTLRASMIYALMQTKSISSEPDALVFRESMLAPA